MEASLPQSPAAPRDRFTWLGIVLLLLLRLPWLTGVPIALGTSPWWIDPVFEIGTYLVTAWLIWHLRDDPAPYHLDGLVVLLFVLAKPLEPVILTVWGIKPYMALGSVASYAFFAIAVALTLALWRRAGRLRVTARGVAWLVAGAALGAALTVATSLAMIALGLAPVPHDPGSMALLAPLYQLGYAAVDEEPLFRGLLWGALRKAGWRDLWICLFQALLFTVGHLYYWPNPQAELGLAIIFVVSLLMGLVAWRARSIAASMAFHAAWNGATGLIYAVTARVF